MIDFENASYLKLRPADEDKSLKLVSPILVDDEEIFASFKTVRDMVVFTNKRVIAINVKGVTGSKKDFTSMPYSKVQAFSVETSGTFDMDSEVELWFSGLGSVKFEFLCTFDIHTFNRLLGQYIL